VAHFLLCCDPLFCSSNLRAEPTDALLTKLVGLWQTESERGIVPHVAQSHSFLMLGPDGRYLLAIVRQEMGQAPISFNSMGHYDVDPSGRLLIAHVEASTHSSRAGSEQRRYITFLEAGEMRWRVSYSAPEIIWRRLAHSTALPVGDRDLRAPNITPSAHD